MEVTVYDSISAAPIYGEGAPHDSALATVILVYSDDQSVRAAVRTALGSKLPGESREHKVVEFATADALRLYIREKRKIDLFILDGEAVPEGGLVLAHALKVISHPIDPFTLGQKVAELLA